MMKTNMRESIPIIVVDNYGYKEYTLDELMTDYANDISGDVRQAKLGVTLPKIRSLYGPFYDEDDFGNPCARYETQSAYDSYSANARKSKSVPQFSTVVAKLRKKE